MFSNIYKDEKLAQRLCKTLINLRDLRDGNEPIDIIQQKETHRIHRRGKRKRKVFQLGSQIVRYDVKDVMLEIRSDANIFCKSHGK